MSTSGTALQTQHKEPEPVVSLSVLTGQHAYKKQLIQTLRNTIMRLRQSRTPANDQQIITLEAEVADMVERFETRKLVDRAKGLLNEKMGLSEPEAFRWIQKASMDRRLTMHDVAQAIIEQIGRAHV